MIFLILLATTTTVTTTITLIITVDLLMVIYFPQAQKMSNKYYMNKIKDYSKKMLCSNKNYKKKKLLLTF